MVDIQILRDGVLWIEEEHVEKTEGGIYIPDSHKPRQRCVGRVVAIGPDVTEVKVGDRVIYGELAGRHYTHQQVIDNEVHEADMLLGIEDDIWAVIPEDTVVGRDNTGHAFVNDYSGLAG